MRKELEKATTAQEKVGPSAQAKWDRLEERQHRHGTRAKELVEEKVRVQLVKRYLQLRKRHLLDLEPDEFAAPLKQKVVKVCAKRWVL